MNFSENDYIRIASILLNREYIRNADTNELAVMVRNKNYQPIFD